MIRKKTVIDQIEVTRTGAVCVRFALLVIDGDQVIASSFHRTSIEPGADVDAQIAAVNADITCRPELRASPIEDGDLTLAHLKRVAGAIHNDANV